MATATSGSVTATMTAATAAQVGYWERYQATIEVLRREMGVLVAASNSGEISEAVRSDRMACLVDLCGQAQAQWESAAPAIEWS